MARCSPSGPVGSSTHCQTLPNMSYKPKALGAKLPTGAVLRLSHWLPQPWQLALPVPRSSPHQRAVAAGVLAPAKKAALTRARNAIRPGDLQRSIDALASRLERLALSKTTAAPRPVNRAFNKRDRPEVLGEATN